MAKLQLSHIVPEFAYSQIYDDKHKLIMWDPRHPEGGRKAQKGVREPMLCSDCEQFLNDSYEKWFKEFWFDKRPLTALELRDSQILAIPDPGRFKLFHLSVLLRADLARNRPWSIVEIGSRHRTRLMRMVRSKDAGEPHDYPIVCTAFRRSAADPSIWWDVVALPTTGRMDGVRFYKFVFGGCSWMYFVGSHRNALLEEIALRPDGRLPVAKKEWDLFTRRRSPAPRFRWTPL